MPRSRYMVGLVFLTLFVMSVLTNIRGPLVSNAGPAGVAELAEARD